MLKLCDIVKNYPTATTTVHALRGVSLCFREHEFVSILGPSGCGKTTMLNIIGGLDRYTSGDLVIGGVSTASFDDQHWDAYRNATVGFVFQSYNLIPHLTVLENVELALSLVGEKKRIRRTKAIEALRRVGMDGEINKRPNQLSGGQMQRVAIARAIVNDPKIILADEPTGALDSELSVQVMEILREIADTRLVIMVTHNAELAQQYSSRICRFKDGKLIEDTNPFDGETQEEPAEIEEETPAPEVEEVEDDLPDKKELVTTDTVSLAEEEPAQESEEPKREVTDEYATSTVNSEKVRIKSNRKRKKQMKNMRADSMDLFERLGLNSLSKLRKKTKKKEKTFKPTSMSAGMAFGLSLRNLISKKRRTLLTVFAGSIGIIGLGLVLSISNGFNVFVEKMQTDMLAGVPIGIYEYNVEVSAVMDVMSSLAKPNPKPDAYPDSDKIVINQASSGGSSGLTDILSSFFKTVSKNELTDDFAEYIAKMPNDYYSARSIYYGVRYNLIAEQLESDGTTTYIDASQCPDPSTVMTIATTVLGESGVQPPYWQVLVGDETNMLKHYDLLGENSKYPKDKTEILLCVGESNQIDKNLLDTFGLSLLVKNEDDTVSPIDIESVDVDFFIGKTLKLVSNNEYFVETPELFYYPNDYYATSEQKQDAYQQMYESENAIELKISGVIRPKKHSQTSYVSNALCYTPELAEYVVNAAYESNIAKEQRKIDKAAPDEHYSVFGGIIEDDDLTEGSSILTVIGNSLNRTSFLKAIGATKAPTFVSVYPATYAQKIAAGNYISDWNNKYNGKVGYFDVSEMFIYNLNLIIELVSVMLIAVASISLVVSTVMIGVITSNSVVERTREIGILRSIGARKRDIRNVFVAETSLIGLASGIMGIVATYIIAPIMSVIIHKAVGVGSLLHFHPLHAFLLVVLSFVLTVISGIIPAINASRKNVVDALRIE